MIRSTTALPDGAAALLNPEVTTRGLLEPDHELHRDGLIEAQTLALGLDELVSLLEREIVPLADADLRRVSRQGRRDRERDHRDREQHAEQREDGSQKAHHTEAAGDILAPAAVRSVESRRRPLGEVGTVESLISDRRRVDALQSLRSDVLVRRDHRVERGCLGQHEPLHCLESGAVLRLVLR